MIQSLQMVSLGFSVLAAVVAVTVLTRAFWLLGLLKEQAWKRKDTASEGGKDG